MSRDVDRFAEKRDKMAKKVAEKYRQESLEDEEEEATESN